MLDMLLITSMITMMITASTMKDGLNEERMLRLINQRNKLFPQDLLKTTVSFIDSRSDAQIWFEAFKDPNERMRIFNATTWGQLYNECQGSNENIKNRVNSGKFKFYIGFDESSQSITKIIANVASYLLQFPPDNEAIFKSLYLNDLKQLRSLNQIDIHYLSSGQTVPDFNGWSDELEDIRLGSNNLIGSVSFTGFPNKLSRITLSNNPQLNGDITLPEGDIASDFIGIHFVKNPNLYISQEEAITRIKYHGTPHYDIDVSLWEFSDSKSLALISHRRSADIYRQMFQCRQNATEYDIESSRNDRGSNYSIFCIVFVIMLIISI